VSENSRFGIETAMRLPSASTTTVRRGSGPPSSPGSPPHAGMSFSNSVSIHDV
jgi:hypothetical protein